MSECEANEALLAAEADGVLGESERDALMAHLSGCTTCQSRLDEQRVVGALLRDQTPPPVSEQEWATQWQRIAEAVPQRRPAHKPTAGIGRPFWLPATMAAAVGFAAVVWFVAGRVSESFARPVEVALAGEAEIEELAIDDEQATGMIIQTSPEYAAVIWIDTEPQEEASL